MNKPIVGVMPLWDEEKESLWMLPGYMDALREAGALPIMFPLSTDMQDLLQLADICDGFLFTGGQDVSPELYSEPPLDGLVECFSPRDEMEHIMLRYAIKENKPLLGICRGIQFINADLGGSLYQDLPTQHPSKTEHHQSGAYHLPIHSVVITPDTPLAKCLQIRVLPVNSYHHQAIKELAPCLETMAISEDGLIEAVYMRDHRFLWAVQWHPEFSHKQEETSRKVFRAFVNALS